MKLVYVAGPFRAKTHWNQELNIRNAEMLALRLWKMGAAVICPHTNTRFYQGECPDETWLEGDLEMLRRCDAIVMTNFWELSKGAVQEHALARELGLNIFHEKHLELFSEWANGHS